MSGEAGASAEGRFATSSPTNLQTRRGRGLARRRAARPPQTVCVSSLGRSGGRRRRRTGAGGRRRRSERPAVRHTAGEEPGGKEQRE